MLLFLQAEVLTGFLARQLQNTFNTLLIEYFKATFSKNILKGIEIAFTISVTALPHKYSNGHCYSSFTYFETVSDFQKY